MADSASVTFLYRVGQVVKYRRREAYAQIYSRTATEYGKAPGEFKITYDTVGQRDIEEADLESISPEDI